VETFDQGKEKNEGNNNDGRKQRLLKNKEFEEMKRTANKFSILETLPDDDLVEIRILKDRMIEKWKDDEDNVVEDIVEEVNELERNVIANEIVGRGSNILNQS
ncbi:hypothetical protein Tco_0512389, partial [Tanacetum coccineum]